MRHLINEYYIQREGNYFVIYYLKDGKYNFIFQSNRKKKAIKFVTDRHGEIR